MTKTIERTHGFQGDLNTALHSYLKNDPNEFAGQFWYLDATIEAVNNLEDTKKTMHVLRKHLPSQVHDFVRIALPTTRWKLHILDGEINHTLNGLVRKIRLPIAKELGFMPTIQVIKEPNPIHWAKAGKILAAIPSEKTPSRNTSAIPILKKHLPAELLHKIRFRPPRTTWNIFVEKSTVANQVKAILWTELPKITRQIGFTPQVNVVVSPSHYRWSKTGLPLNYPDQAKTQPFNEADAQQFLSEFIKK